MAVKIVSTTATYIPMSLPMAASTTIVANSFLTSSSGYLTPATSSTTALHIVALEGAVTGAGEHTKIQVAILTPSTIMEVDTTDVTAQSQCLTYIDLTNATEANNGASSTDVLEVIELVGATTDKKLLVRANPAK